jgi:hypothetical protein
MVVLLPVALSALAAGWIWQPVEDTRSWVEKFHFTANPDESLRFQSSWSRLLGACRVVLLEKK